MNKYEILKIITEARERGNVVKIEFFNGSQAEGIIVHTSGDEDETTSLTLRIYGLGSQVFNISAIDSLEIIASDVLLRRLYDHQKEIQNLREGLADISGVVKSILEGRKIQYISWHEPIPISNLELVKKK